MDNKGIKEVYLKRKSYQSLEVDDADIQLQYVLKYIPADRTAPILDAGCGNGKRALKLFTLGYSNISAVDLFESIPIKEIAYQKASIENLPYRESTFQYIYAMSVIYYPDNTEKVIQEFSRIMQMDGLLLMTAHTKYSLFTLRRIIMRFLKRKVVRHLQDVKFKSAHDYIKLLKRSNFEIVLVDGFYLSYVFVPVYRFIRSLLSRCFKVTMPEIHPTVTKNRILARIKSVFAYHMVIVARKTNTKQASS